MSETLSLVGAARRAGVTVGTVRYWILSGRLPAEKTGSYWSIRPEDVDHANEEAQRAPKAGNRSKRGRYVREPAG